MGETPAERAERLRKFAEENNRRVAENQEEGRRNRQEQTARENLDKKDSES